MLSFFSSRKAIDAGGEVISVDGGFGLFFRSQTGFCELPQRRTDEESQLYVLLLCDKEALHTGSYHGNQ